MFKIRNRYDHVVINGKKAYDPKSSTSGSAITSGSAFTSGSAADKNQGGGLSPGEQESILKNLRSVAGRLVEEQQTTLPLESLQNTVSQIF